MTIPLGFIENIGPTQLLIVLGIVLLLFGGKKLPELANSLGRSLGEFKKGAAEGEKLVYVKKPEEDVKTMATCEKLSSGTKLADVTTAEVKAQEPEKTEGLKV